MPEENGRERSWDPQLDRHGYTDRKLDNDKYKFTIFYI
jgi:hypothetical protein